MRRLALLTLALIGTAASAGGRQPSIAVGDASISGRVIDRLAERPLEGVIVTLEGSDPQNRLLTLTDRDGRYVFEHLPAAQYRVNASYPGYVTFHYGPADGRRFGALREGLLTLERRQARTGVDFALTRGGTLSGRITSQDGKALAGAYVSLTARTETGGFVMDGAWSVRTNERGEYVVAGLADGQYRVSASWNDPGVPSSAGAAAARRTFFPGTENAREATFITVSPGETVRNVDISIPLTELVRMQGKVVRGSSGGTILAYLLGSGSDVYMVHMTDDGDFTTPRLRAGRYTLVARTQGDHLPEAASLTVDLTFEMTGIVLGLAPTGSITGRVVTDDGSPVPAAVQVAAVLTEDGKEIDPYRRDRADVAADGAFEITGLFGTRVLRLVGQTAGWTIAEVTIDKQPLTSLTVEGGIDLVDVVVRLRRGVRAGAYAAR